MTEGDWVRLRKYLARIQVLTASILVFAVLSVIGAVLRWDADNAALNRRLKVLDERSDFVDTELKRLLKADRIRRERREAEAKK